MMASSRPARHNDPVGHSSTALHPCRPCQLRKRRCGRELPVCALCKRTRRDCKYPPGSAPEPPEPAHQQPGVLDHVLPNRFPASYFLDQRMYRLCQLTINTPPLKISPIIWESLADMDYVRHTADRYFSTVHLWFPIINRSKFYGSLLQRHHHYQAEVGLLLVCVRLLVTQPHQVVEGYNEIYVSVKHAFLQLELSGALSITILQALLLTALCEISRGVYPAAYLTVATCARYAVALNLDRDSQRWSSDQSDWMTMEEKHRIWWAVLLLDRCVTMSCPKRSLCTPEPTESQYLPIFDDDWDQGHTPSRPPYQLSTSADVKMGKFARLAQATHLVGRVLRHLSDHSGDKEFLSEERAVLDRALRSLLSLTVAEENAGKETAFCSPIALLSCALMTLHSHLDESSTGLNYISTSGSSEYLAAVKTNTEVVAPIVRRIIKSWPSAPRYPSPVVLDWMYRCHVAFDDCESPQYKLYLQDIREAIRLLSLDWAVGEIYSELLETRALMKMPINNPIDDSGHEGSS